MPMRGLVFGFAPGDFHRAGRTERSLVAAGLAIENEPARSAEALVQRLRAVAGPLLLAPAGAWLTAATPLAPFQSSATGRPLIGLGAIHHEPAWKRHLARCGGDLAEELDRQHVRVCVAAFGRPTRLAFPEPKNFADLSDVLNDPAARADVVLELAQSFGADLVHAHLIRAAEAREIKARGLPLAMTIHNMPPAWPAGLADADKRHADLFFACSRAGGDRRRSLHHWHSRPDGLEWHRSQTSRTDRRAPRRWSRLACRTWLGRR